MRNKKHDPQSWRIFTSGIYLILMLGITLGFIMINKEYALRLALMCLSGSIVYGITITDWKVHTTEQRGMRK